MLMGLRWLAARRLNCCFPQGATARFPFQQSIPSEFVKCNESKRLRGETHSKSTEAHSPVF
jgi:hypothetical protein